MNFLIIGHSVVDKIIEDENPSIKPGGIFYTVISLLSQIEPNDKVFLCSSMNNEYAARFELVYSRIESEFLRTVKSIPIVELVVDKSGERKETYSEIPESLEIPFIGLERFDGILINMITGYDISLQQLQKLRKNYNGLIYFDVHTLSRGVNEDLKRNFRQINDFNKWAKCIDILQANVSELQTLYGEKEEIEIVDKLIICGVKQVVVTKASEGATVYFKVDSSINSIHRDAVKVNTINKVGCGDVFGAVYFYNYIKNKNILAALEHANISAGISTTYSETDELLKLKKDANERIS